MAIPLRNRSRSRDPHHGNTDQGRLPSRRPWCAIAPPRPPPKRPGLWSRFLRTAKAAMALVKPSTPPAASASVTSRWSSRIRTTVASMWRSNPAAYDAANHKDQPMRLTTILDPRFPMNLRERVNRLKEWSVMGVAWRLPRVLVYWTVIRGTVSAAGDHRNPADVTAVEIIEFYEEEKS